MAIIANNKLHKHEPNRLSNQHLDRFQQLIQLPTTKSRHPPPEADRQWSRPTAPPQSHKSRKQTRPETHRQPETTHLTPPLATKNQKPPPMPGGEMQNHPARPARTNQALGECARPDQDCLDLRAAAGFFLDGPAKEEARDLQAVHQS